MSALTKNDLRSVMCVSSAELFRCSFRLAIVRSITCCNMLLLAPCADSLPHSSLSNSATSLMFGSDSALSARMSACTARYEHIKLSSCAEKMNSFSAPPTAAG
jgi:hypothetical protein